MKREFLYITVRYQNKELRGEYVPYPYPSRHETELINELQQAVEFFFRHLYHENHDLKESFRNIHRSFNKKIGPTMIFSIESLAVWAYQKNPVKENFPFFHKDNQITLNALLGKGTPNQIRIEADQLWNRGYRCFKLKIRPHWDNITRFHALTEITGDAGSIRLDANGSFELKDMIRLAQQLPAHLIEYIEEPVSNSKDFFRFYEAVGIFYALDESLGSQPNDLEKFSHKWSSDSGLYALILKPARIGLYNALQWVQLARTLSLKPIFTSNFETTLGLCAILPFIDDSKTPMGFDTFRHLPQDSYMNQYFKLRKNKLTLSLPFSLPTAPPIQATSQ